MKLQTECTFADWMYVATIVILEGKGEGTTIPIDPVELINVVRYDLLSQETAPFGYFFRSRLNCKI